MGSAHPSTDCCSKSSLGNILENYVTGAGIERKGKRKGNQDREDDVRVGLVSLAVDRGAPADLVQVYDKDGEGCSKGGQWTELKQEEQQPSFCKHKQPTIGVNGRQGLPPYTSRGGIPSYIDYMAGFPPEPPPS